MQPLNEPFSRAVIVREKDEEADAAVESVAMAQQSTFSPTVTVLDWNGHDDTDNPLNWSMWQRVYHTTVPALLGFVVTLGSSIYTPGIPGIMAQFNVSSTVALLGLSLYVLVCIFPELGSSHWIRTEL